MPAGWTWIELRWRVARRLGAGCCRPRSCSSPPTTRGPAGAAVTIVVSNDLEWSSRQGVLRRTTARYPGQLLFALRWFPRQSNPQTYESAVAPVYGQRQGAFWEMLDLLFARQGAAEARTYSDLAKEAELDVAAFQLCLEDESVIQQIQRDIEDGRSYGVEGTPTCLINGRLVMGSVSFQELDSIISEELR
jgi:predicted DsbA family dithiol-disulfide isomerase